MSLQEHLPSQNHSVLLSQVSLQVSVRAGSQERLLMEPAEEQTQLPPTFQTSSLQTFQLLSEL